MTRTSDPHTQFAHPFRIVFAALVIAWLGYEFGDWLHAALHGSA